MFTLLLLLTLTGTWEGEATASAGPVFMTLRLPGDDAKGSLFFLGQNFPIDAITEDNGKLKVAAGPNVLEGEVGNELFTGTFSQGPDLRLPVSLGRVPDYPTPKDRIEGWKQDLDALSTRFLKFDRSFSPGERARFLEVIDATRSKLPNLTDAEVMMRMASAVSLSNNAHTRLYLVRNRTEVRRLPVRLWWFRDGLRVVRATPEHRNLLGCRVDDIGGTDARHARDIVSAAFAGNPSWRDYKSVYFMTSPEALYGFGITRDLESVDFGLSDCGPAPFRAVVKPLPLLKKTRPVEAWWDLSPQHEDVDRHWSHPLHPAKAPTYLRNPQNYYWFEFLPQSGIFYFHYNRASDMLDETTKAFAERLLADYEKRAVKALVVDLRFNTGGDSGLARDLMKRLEERTRTIPRFVITGRATFSAGMDNAATWRVAPNVTFVGEPVGDELEYMSEGGNIILPYSKLYAHFANGTHAYSKSFGPDVPVSSTWAQYIAGTDVALDAVRRLMDAQRVVAASAPTP
jgi:hypothetical protein